MKKLRKHFKKKRLKSWKSGFWMLYRDCVAAKSSLLVHQFLAKNQIPVILQTPYSSDLFRAIFFSWFLKSKSTFKGRCFQIIDCI